VGVSGKMRWQRKIAKNRLYINRADSAGEQGGYVLPKRGWSRAYCRMLWL